MLRLVHDLESDQDLCEVGAVAVVRQQGGEEAEQLQPPLHLHLFHSCHQLLPFGDRSLVLIISFL